jgi:hypothetical protein
MDAALFNPAPLGLRARLLMLPLADRFTYDAATRTMFINFERLSIRNAEDVEAVRQEVEAHLVPLGHKVYGVVNYDHFALDPEVQDDWAAMVRELVDRHYISVARYTTSGFLRAKLGPALAARGVAPHIYETAADAQGAVRSKGRCAAAWVDVMPAARPLSRGAAARSRPCSHQPVLASGWRQGVENCMFIQYPEGRLHPPEGPEHGPAAAKPAPAGHAPDGPVA